MTHPKSYFIIQFSIVSILDVNSTILLKTSIIQLSIVSFRTRIQHVLATIFPTNKSTFFYYLRLYRRLISIVSFRTRIQHVLATIFPTNKSTFLLYASLQTPYPIIHCVLSDADSIKNEWRYWRKFLFQDGPNYK